MASDPNHPDSDHDVPGPIISNQSGGIDIDAKRVDITGDVIGRDKITNIGYTVEQVSTLLTQITSTFQPKPFDGRCPYLGLDAFSEDDADRFFGRETLIAELIGRVQAARFLVIAGPSGSGKSSLVRAGLLYQLKQGALPNSARWLYATLTPGRDPIESLARAVSRLKSPDLGDYLRQHASDPDALHKCAESALSDLKDQRAVIFVDQFEEVFTQVSKESDRVTFLNLLTTAATIAGGRVSLLFALRSDFVANCATYPQLNALLNQQFLQVGAMQPADLVSAISRPALEVGLRIDPDLVKQIVDDMRDEPGVLPLMQFALKDLFDAEQAKGGLIALTLSDYLARGGLRKALERHADAAFAKLNVNEQQLARSIFAGLIEIGSGREDTRRTASFAELVPASATADPVQVVIEKLADARLITTDEIDHQETVTISHERLIDAWPWLRNLIDENRESIALQNEIARDAQEWNDNQRDASYLYTGARLATAREQLTARQIVLNELAQAFVDGGIQAERNELEEVKRRAAQLRRRAIYLIGALGVAVLLGIIAGSFSLQSNRAASNNATLAAQNAAIAGTAQANADEARQQTRLAVARQLAAQSLTLLDDHFDLALLLATSAYQIDNTAEARGSLLSTLQHNPLFEAFARGHSDAVVSMAFSPDGKILASGSWDGTNILWDVKDLRAPKQLATPLTDDMQSLRGVAFSPDGKTLASGSWDKKIILWDVTNPRNPMQLGAPLTGYKDAVDGMAFSPDGKTLAGGSDDGAIILWDVTDPRMPTQFGAPLTGHTKTVLSVAFSPDGKILASGSWDKTIILWDVTNPQVPLLLGKLTGHTSSVNSVAFSPDGKTLASASDDKTIILWNVTNPHAPTPLGKPLTGHMNVVWSVQFSPDGQTLASSSSDKAIILWDVTNPRAPTPRGKPLTGQSNAVDTVAFSPDGKTLASGSWDKSIILWDVTNQQAPTPLGTPLTSDPPAGYGVAFSPDGKTLASGNWDGKIILQDVTDPRAPTQLGAPLIGHTKAVLSVAFSPDGKTLASASSDKTISLWDVTNPHAPTQLGAPLIGHTMAVLSVAFSPDGKTLASASDDKTIILWDVTNPRTPTPLGASLSGHTDSVGSVAFSPDDKTLASGSADGTVILWNISNPRDSKLLRKLTGYTSSVNSVAFSPDGKTLASGIWDNTIVLWDVTDLSAPARLGDSLTGHANPVDSVAFSPDGKTLASSSEDGTIILWDMTNPRTPTWLGRAFIGHTQGVDSVAFSPDGKTLASGDWGGTTILWDIDPNSWQNRACQIAGRNFDQSEWKQYLGTEPYRQTCPQWPAGK